MRVTLSEASVDRRTPPEPEIRPADTPVRLGHLTDLVGYMLRRAQLAAFRNFSRRFEGFDIRPTQLGVLSVVEGNPGLRPSQVGAALGIQRANLVPLLNGLEARGLLARARDPSDGRSHVLTLTPDGAALYAQLRVQEIAHEAEISALLGEGGRRELLDLLARVQQASDEAAAGEA